MAIIERKVNWSDRFSNRQELSESGFVAAKAMHMDYDLRQLQIPPSSWLRNAAKSRKDLMCVKCIVAGTPSYWYKKSDLKRIYSGDTHNQ